MWVEGTAQAKKLSSRKKEVAFWSLAEDEDLVGQTERGQHGWHPRSGRPGKSLLSLSERQVN